MNGHDLSLVAWILLAFGAFTIGVSKTGLAGIGILAVAFFAIVLPPKDSVGIVLPILIVADVLAMAAYRRHAVWHHLWRLMPCAAIGIVLASLLVDRLDGNAIGKLIGVILLVVLGLNWWRKRRPEAEEDAPKSPLFTTGMGIAAGFTTQIANAAGPIMIIYLLGMGLPKMEFMGTGAWYYMIMNCFKVPFMIHSGQITWDSFLFSAKLFPFAILGGACGKAIFKRLNQELFEKSAIWMTWLAAIYLLCGRELISLIRS